MLSVKVRAHHCVVYLTSTLFLFNEQRQALSRLGYWTSVRYCGTSPSCAQKVSVNRVQELLFISMVVSVRCL